MEIKDLLKKHAIEYAAKNTIVRYGEIVETRWADWKKPHKVKIDKIGAALSVHSWRIVNGRKRYKKHVASFAMYYYAMRLTADGSPKDKAGQGIVLGNFKKADGQIWQATDEVLNHVAYHWRLSKRDCPGG